MAISAFAVKVPEAEHCVADLRKRYDAAATLGVPAHISILVPFMPPEQISDTVIDKLCSFFVTVRPFEFSLSRIGRFPATTYLAPEPAEPFIAITQRLVELFPDYPPYAGQFDTIIPHLTVANNTTEGAEIAAQELNGIMQAHGPIRSHCDSVVLLENSSGKWSEMRAFGLRA